SGSLMIFFIRRQLLWRSAREQGTIVMAPLTSRAPSAEVAQLVEQWSEELRTVSPSEFLWKLAADTCFQPTRTNSLAAT
ncbi:MAG: hypothetical protein M3T56_06065, partial [Chloroflexota bacterium]|nr:hypothetical protein [Chloroflexota bacterium]